MAETRYFAIDPGSIDDDVAVLGGEEFHHLIRVVRARRGDLVRLLDGLGGIYSAVLRDIGSDEAILDIREKTVHELSPMVDIAISAINASRLDIAAEKCSEIGMRRLIVFYSERSIRKPGKRGDMGKRERLRRKAVAACKQSGQPFFPEVVLCDGLDDLIRKCADYEHVFLADQEGSNSSGDSVIPSGGPTLGIVGPEGGFTDRERGEIVSAGATTLSLGDFRLRSETAAICLLFSLHSRLRGATS